MNHSTNSVHILHRPNILMLYLLRQCISWKTSLIQLTHFYLYNEVRRSNIIRTLPVWTCSSVRQTRIIKQLHGDIETLYKFSSWPSSNSYLSLIQLTVPGQFLHRLLLPRNSVVQLCIPHAGLPIKVWGAITRSSYTTSSWSRWPSFRLMS